MGAWTQMGCKHKHKERRKRTKKTEEQAGMGSHRQEYSQVSGHVKEKKSEHHVMCRQTCMFPNLNKTCTCLCPPCLPTCAWMCVSHFFLFFSLIFLFASFPCTLVPGSTCPCLHPPVPGFLCLPLPTDSHLTMPGHT